MVLHAEHCWRISLKDFPQFEQDWKCLESGSLSTSSTMTDCCLNSTVLEEHSLSADNPCNDAKRLHISDNEYRLSVSHREYTVDSQTPSFETMAVNLCFVEVVVVVVDVDVVVGDVVGTAWVVVLT